MVHAAILNYNFILHFFSFDCSLAPLEVENSYRVFWRALKDDMANIITIAALGQLKMPFYFAPEIMFHHLTFAFLGIVSITRGLHSILFIEFRSTTIISFRDQGALIIFKYLS